jgi:exopolyphosphatase/guanosine-5'-triphosphate,3'-diphosphate pyrophosphatase
MRYAAIDVGSNSIRLLVSEVDAGGRTMRLHAERDVVRLSEGVFRDGRLTGAATDQACRVLARMTAAIRRHEVAGVRAVATSAVRDAANAGKFMHRASDTLGFPVDVIGGLEEARLVRRGVSARWPSRRGRVLVADVGGGSAQLILSDGDDVVAEASLPLGAVRLTEMFIRTDPPMPSELAEMRRFIRTTLQEPSERPARAGVRRLIATSATAGAVVCAANGIPRSRRDDADRASATAGEVRDLLDTLAGSDAAGRVLVAGIGRRRAEIIVAGVAVLEAVVACVAVPALYYSTAGVCDGIIAELADARHTWQDPRRRRARRSATQTFGGRAPAAPPHAG